MLKARSFYQDRLGTDIGKGEETNGFSQAYAGWFLRFRDGVTGSNYSSDPCTIQGDPPASSGGGGGGGGHPSMIQVRNATFCVIYI
jgi:hypothetical protein